MEGQLIDRTFYGLNFNFIDMIFHGQEHFMDMTFQCIDMMFHGQSISWTVYFMEKKFHQKDI